jgi:cell shape-determining protein MreC
MPQRYDRVPQYFDMGIVTTLSGATIATAYERWIIMVTMLLLTGLLFVYKRYLSEIIARFKEKIREEEKKQAEIEAEKQRALQLKQMQEAVKNMRRAR